MRLHFVDVRVAVAVVVGEIVERRELVAGHAIDGDHRRVAVDVSRGVGHLLAVFGAETVGAGLAGAAVAVVLDRVGLPLGIVAAAGFGTCLGWRLLAMHPWGRKADDLHVYFYSAPPEVEQH